MEIIGAIIAGLFTLLGVLLSYHLRDRWKKRMSSISSTLPEQTTESTSHPLDQQSPQIRDRVEIVRAPTEIIVGPPAGIRVSYLDDILLKEFECKNKDKAEDIETLVINLYVLYDDCSYGQFPIPVPGDYEGITFRQVVARAFEEYEKYPEWIKRKRFERSWDDQWLDYLRRKDESIKLELNDAQKVNLPWSEKIDPYVIEECYSSDDWIYPGINLYIEEETDG